MRWFLLLLIFISFKGLEAQELSLENGILFWTAQDWPCEQIDIIVYDSDTNIVYEDKLDSKYNELSLPSCGNENVLSFINAAPNAYFFVAECAKDACDVCGGDGSYWQSTAQEKTEKSVATRSKTHIDGYYKTCHICGGEGVAYQMMWIDTFSVDTNQCRTILLH